MRLRPLICVGYRVLQEQASIRKLLSLQDLYLAVLISSKQLEVRLRPELRAGEDFIEDVTVEQALKQGALADSEKMLELFTEVGRSTPPESLLASIIDTLFHRYYGMEALALASVVEREKFSEKIVGLPALPDVAESAEQKMAIARIWLRQWQKNGFLAEWNAPGVATDTDQTPHWQLRWDAIGLADETGPDRVR